MARFIATVIISICLIQVLYGRSLTELRDLENKHTTNNPKLNVNNETEEEETAKFIDRILFESERLSDEFETALKHLQKVTSLVSKLIHHTVVFEDNVTTAINIHPEM